jgi:hypothetical protein
MITKMKEETPMIDIDEMLNGDRPYDPYVPGNDRATLESLKQSAAEGLLNEPEGNAFVLRLIEVIEVLQSELSQIVTRNS